jgi:glycosyltransferase involved in cell wall biosynthesis
VTAPVATIVIATRDRPHLARRALRSALHQTTADFEVIVVDDGSTDQFEAHTNDTRLRVIRHDRPRGVCAARNAGLQAARAEWITFLDDDDELRPSMVELSLRAGRESHLPPPVAVLSGRADIDASGRTITKHIPVTLPRGSHYFLERVTHGSFKTENTLFAPVDVLREIGGWDEAIRSWEHDDLFLRLNVICSLQSVPAVTYLWHAHDGERRHEDMMDCANGMARTLQKHRDVFDLYPRDLAHYLGTMGIAYLNAGRWGRAISTTTRSIVRDPRQPRLWLWWLASLGGPRPLAWYRAGRRWLRDHSRSRAQATGRADGFAGDRGIIEGEAR